jgi:CIC family chloride channel protein
MHISRPDAVLSLSVLGLLAGVLAAMTIIALRLLVDEAQVMLYPMQTAGDFESLSPVLRAGIAVAGGVLIGILVRLAPPPTQTVGVQIGFTDAAALGIYAMIGMGAMMAGTMQAPMAGLIGILELTGEPRFILPGMLAVVASTIVSGRLHHRESLFHSLLRAKGVDYRSDPLSKSLRRIGVAGVMSRSIEVLPRRVDAAEVDRTLGSQPAWVLIKEDEVPTLALAGVDLAYTRKQSPGGGGDRSAGNPRRALQPGCGGTERYA